MAEQRRSQCRWNRRSQRSQLRSTGAAADQEFIETMPLVLGRRESLTRSRLKHPMSRWVLKTPAKPRSSVLRRSCMGLETCVLEAQDDVHDKTLGTPTHPTENFGENATDEDIAAPEVTEELNRLKSLAEPTKPRVSIS